MKHHGGRRHRQGGKLPSERVQHDSEAQRRIRTIILARDRRSRAEAFLTNPDSAPGMARFPKAERRLVIKMICMQCYARNAMRATRCRKCGSRELRPKAKEARKE